MIIGTRIPNAQFSHLSTLSEGIGSFHRHREPYTAMCVVPMNTAPPLSIGQMCPGILIVAHMSGSLTSAQRFPLRAHDIVRTARGSRLCIRSAAFPTEVKDVVASFAMLAPRILPQANTADEGLPSRMVAAQSRNQLLIPLR